MADVKVTMKDGSIRQFKQETRPGGSYQQKVRYESAFFVVVDVWGKEICIPVIDIKEIEIDGPRAW